MRTYYCLFFWTLFLVGSFTTSPIHAQSSCTHTIESSVTFVTQAGMETYLDDIGCTVDTIRGDLFLGPNLTSLEPLQGLKHIGGGVLFSLGFELETLNGLDSLETIDDWFLMNTIGLTTLDNLSKLRSVGANRDGISTESLSFNIDLHNAFLDTISFESLETINSARSTLRVYGAPALPFLSSLDHIGRLTIFQSDSIRRLPPLNNLKSVHGLKIEQCQNLESIIFQGLDSIESIQINRCPNLDSVVFEKPLTFSTIDPFIEINNNERLSYFEADFHLLPDVELSMELYDFPLLDSLPDFSNLAFKNIRLDNIGVIGPLDFSGARPAARINSRIWEPESYSFQVLPNVDTLWIPELKGGTLFINRSDNLTSVLGGGLTPEIYGAAFDQCHLLAEIEFLQHLTHTEIDNGLYFKELETFSFLEGDLRNLQKVGCLSFEDLPSIQPGSFPPLLSLDSVYYLNINRVAFDTLQLLGANNDFIRSFHFSAVAGDPTPSYLELNTEIDGVGLNQFDELVDHCADLYPPGVEIDFNNSNVSISGFENVTKTGRVGYTNAGDLTPDPHSNFLPNATEIGELFYRNHNREDLFSIGNLSKLTPIDSSASPFRIVNGRLSIKTSPLLQQAEFLCPIVKSGTIEEYDLEGNMWPFNNRRTIITYCDQISSSTENGKLVGLNLYPTAARAGSTISIEYDGLLDGGFQYKIVNNLGVQIQEGTLNSQLSQIALSSALTSGTYFVQIYSVKEKFSTVVPILLQ